MPYQRSNLTDYDWATIRVEAIRTRVHTDEWFTTLGQLAAMWVGFWAVNKYAEGNSLLGGIGAFAVIIAAAMFKHYSMKRPRSELQKAEERQEYYWDKADED